MQIKSYKNLSKYDILDEADASGKRRNISRHI